MKKAYQFFFVIERKHLEEQDVAAVLDMLRYDNAMVENNPPTGYYLFSSERTPTLTRWASFGIKIAATTRSEWNIPSLVAQAQSRKEAPP